MSEIAEIEVETAIPDLSAATLDEIAELVKAGNLDPYLPQMLADIERPRFNLGGSGPPGRVD
jgi:hypothetical protein